MHYLSGNDPSTFSSHLDLLDKDYSLDTELQSYLWNVFKNPPSDRFQILLSRFSEVEQSIVCLLALGLTVDQVSGYKGITKIRIMQVISVIRDNDCWKELYGTQETSKG